MVRILQSSSEMEQRDFNWLLELPISKVCKKNQKVKWLKQKKLGRKVYILEVNPWKKFKWIRKNNTGQERNSWYKEKNLENCASKNFQGIYKEPIYQKFSLKKTNIQTNMNKQPSTKRPYKALNINTQIEITRNKDIQNRQDLIPSLRHPGQNTN